jgi:hypothetical protein
VLSARAAKAGDDPAQLELLAMWGEVQDNHADVSCQAWNALLYQVLLLLLL